MLTRSLMILATLVGLAACSDPEKTGRYVIETPSAVQSLPNRIGSAELREVSLPQYASGQEIAWQTPDGALRSTPDNIWADDPSRAITLALARQISTLSGATVIAEPWPLADAPNRKIEVRVEQFLAQADGMVVFSGSYYVAAADYRGGRDLVRRFDLTVPIGAGTQSDPAAIAKAQSQAVALLAERIARLE